MQQHTVSVAGQVKSANDPLEQLAVEGFALADAATRNLAASVPTCPRWTVSDLIEHVGQVHSWVIRCLESNPDDQVRLADEPPAPAQGRIAWYCGIHRSLVERLEAEAPERIVAGPRGPVSVAWWRRRQGHEVSLHRWDAQHAVGQATPIACPWAIDGIDEYCEVFLPVVRSTADLSPRLARLQTGGSGPVWALQFGSGGVTGARCRDGDHDVVIEADASALLLWVWGRPADVWSVGSFVSPETITVLQQRLRY